MSSDTDFFGLTLGDGPGRYHFTVADHLTRLDGRLYGGTAIAVSITCAALASERTPLWMTTQFVDTAPANERVTVHAEVLAEGKRTDQVRVTGTSESGAVMFASLGATGHYREGGLAGTFENPPEVSAPEKSESSGSPFTQMARNAGFDTELPPLPPVGFHTAIEFRRPDVISHPDPGPGRFCVWVRRRDGVHVTPATAAYMADMVPLSVAHACGVIAGGMSLDNSIRIGAFEPTEWVLIDLRPHMAVGDYGHGAAHIWNEHGKLLATASQTAAMFNIDIAELTRRAEGG